jgi:hypothetical protein
MNKMEKPAPGSPEAIEQLLDDLHIKIERIRVLYEQYFMGIEKIEPQVARKDVSRHMLELQQQYIRNTGLRFRFNTMLQKWNIYVTYWNRTLREIENGTYMRHVAKLRRVAAREGKLVPTEVLPPQVRSAPGDPGLGFLDIDTGVHVDQAQERAQQAQPQASGLARQPTPVSGPLPQIPGVSEERLREVHHRYSEARKLSGEAAPVRYETLVRSLAAQLPRVLARPGVKGVRFDVRVEDGKVTLKAIPQK